MVPESYRHPAVGALAPPQPVVVVGQVAVRVVAHKPGAAGDLLMETNQDRNMSENRHRKSEEFHNKTPLKRNKK